MGKKNTLYLCLQHQLYKIHFLQYHSLQTVYFCKRKTSIFISHRLSSTRFCDRILLLSGGRIAEEGTHQSLLQAGGLYAQLFQTQAQYYQKEEQHETN